MSEKRTVVEATPIAAPSSAKNAEGERDPEMMQPKKRNQWYTGAPRTRDEKVPVDDLAILGASDARFAECERQIREECSCVPELPFRPKRCEILQTFLDRSAIYSTHALHRRLEARARANRVAAVAKNAA